MTNISVEAFLLDGKNTMTPYTCLPSRYYSDVSEQQHQKYLNVNQVGSYYVNNEHIEELPLHQGPSGSDCCRELREDFSEGVSYNTDVQLSSSMKNTETLIPALRPPPPNFKKMESLNQRLKSVRNSLSESWDQSYLEDGTPRTPSIIKSTQISHSYFCPNGMNVGNTINQLPSNQNNSGSEERPNQSLLGHSEKILRTNVIDINSESDLFQNDADSLSAQISNMWLEQTQAPLPQVQYQSNVNIYDSQSPSQISCNVPNLWRPKKKKTSNNSDKFCDVRKNSMRRTVENTCPTISQAFFKNTNGESSSGYHYKVENEDKKSLKEDFRQSDKSNFKGIVTAANINSIKQTHSPLVGLSGELREKKLDILLADMPDSSDEERLTALQCTGWDVPAAVKYIKLDRLIR